MLYNSPDDAQQVKTIIEEDPELNKIKDDTRHRDRMAMVQALFTDEFPGQSWSDMELVSFNQNLLDEIRAHKHEYDAQIQTVATERPVHDLAKIDLAILRLILHEHATKDTPVKVLIDEGVELAKDFGAENSYAFVNAVLEKLMLPDGPEAEQQPASETKTDNNEQTNESVAVTVASAQDRTAANNETKE
ncbi:transcription antitermination protein NusB [bacterium]|nr:transcription antitermination protein NusB [bacterium]